VGGFADRLQRRYRKAQLARGLRQLVVKCSTQSVVACSVQLFQQYNAVAGQGDLLIDVRLAGAGGAALGPGATPSFEA